MKTRLRLLLVDDDVGPMRYVIKALERVGYDVTQLESVEEAIEFLKAYSQTVDGVILDLMLPVGEPSSADRNMEPPYGGVTVFRYLQSTHPGLPIIILSNTSSGSLLELFPASDHVRVVRKFDHSPFEIADIVRALVGLCPLDEEGEKSPR